MTGRFRNVTDQLQQGIQRIAEVAARKGVALDIRHLATSARAPEELAAAVDAEPGQIVTAMVFVAPRPEGRVAPIVCLVSGLNEVDLGLLAAVTGEVSLRAATAREAREITGFFVGTIPPFGLGRDVRVLMDEDLCRYQWIWAPAGSEDAVMRVFPGTLRMLSNATVQPLAAAPWLAATSGRLTLSFEAGAGA
jgi:prolyl-tRNA editing enzyme YbaK/EbsC (Cys-tRNA(Pro) deacylase)